MASRLKMGITRVIDAAYGDHRDHGYACLLSHAVIDVSSTTDAAKTLNLGS